MPRSSGVSRSFADFAPGDCLVSSSYTIREKEIIAFAKKFDPQAVHLQPGAKKQGLLGGLAASGWQTAGLSMRLFVQTMQVSGAMIGVAVDGLRWPRPVRPGDRLHVEIRILRTRVSVKRPEFGLIRYRCLTKNQDDEIVQRFLATAILPVKKTRPKKRGQ